MIRGKEVGSVLVLSLVVASMATIVGMQLIMTKDLARRRVEYLVDSSNAARVAAGGLEIARVRLGQDPSWVGVNIGSSQAGDALSVVVEGVGPMDAIAECRAQVGGSSSVLRATLRAEGHPALGYNIVSASDMTIESVVLLGGKLCALGDIVSESPVSLVGAVLATSSSVSGMITGASVTNPGTKFRVPQMPMGEYVAVCSLLHSLPTDARGRVLLVRTSLTPSSNPFGAENPLGVYCLDAGGRDVVVRDFYLDGTFLIRNAGRVTMEGGLHMTPAVPHLATLLVDGDLDLRLGVPLVELVSVMDYNRDGDLLDTFAPLVGGVAQVEGEFVGPYGGVVRGAIIARSTVLRGVVTLQGATSGGGPVVGYVADGAWQVVSGSVAKVIDS